ncbi:FRG domain-containing protein [Rhizobium sp. UGM030330-04]|uniref:FRG domain-containing protein n=1 Tax=Rhizobium sp. UGM030330-04 TaxID=1378077 RepID=UPI000D96F691|nr:FRG domain-containing protein [Rhizobium sp. UGM030330-04]PYG59581.1 FRG domain-containing protein [Rhizobium sp. UGM030330-04]
MPEFTTEVKFDSASAFLAALSPWTSSIDLQGYIFRGHSDDSYELIPASIRHTNKENFWRICGLGKPIDNQSEWEEWHSRAEYNLLREFYKAADRRGLYVPHAERVRSRLASNFDIFPTMRLSPEEWLPNDLLELAGLAQHYGLPTRLLDWSYDPLISAYFAAASAKPGTYLSVWALDADEVSNMNQTIHRSPLRLVTPPYHGNPNLAAQSGIFTSWSVQLQTIHETIANALLIDRRSLDVLMKAHGESQSWKFPRSLFLKFILPSEFASDVLRSLEAAGYGASRIFPGYGGVAKEIVRRHQQWM